MTAKLEVVVLGCGSSGGVPRADGAWGACNPRDKRNWRSRCSLMVRRLDSEATTDRATTLIVDSAPEFRLQCAAAGARRLDALLLTHDHADQVHGIDDIRAFFLNQGARIPCWMNAATMASVGERFAYLFAGAPGPYPPIAEAREAVAGVEWGIDGPSGEIPVLAYEQDHGASRSLGFRFGPLAYSSDVVELPEEAFAALEGVEVWIVDALRYKPHPTHAHVDKALAWIERVRPKEAILTNLHIDLDYAELSARLPPGVRPAHDGLRLTLDISASPG